MSRSFGLCPKCGGETFDDIPCSNGCDDLPKPTDDIRTALTPHKTRAARSTISKESYDNMIEHLENLKILE